jgi:hypothetical protein
MTLRITTLTFLAFYLNGAMDSGRFDDISKSEIEDEIERGTIFDFLRKRLGTAIDLSILSQADEQTLVEEWQDFVSAINARRKFAVENRGITLLVAYLLEGVQRRLP